MAEFHFIRPLWLLAILILIAAIYWLKKIRINQSGWEQILPKHLSKVLINANNNATKQRANNSKPLSLIPPAIMGLLTVIALAGPTWEKQPQPVFKIAQGAVLIMDMSYSMYATDILPNRLTRARYKAIDLLNKLKEGDVGLIAYAGDAFIISPLTEDVNNIKLLLPSLSPALMPVLGSNPIAALTMADNMLKNSGHVNGDIYWLTDGVNRDDINEINHWSNNHPYHLHILGVGTPNGAPIKLPNGELLKNKNGAIVIPHLNPSKLSGLAIQGHGNYQTITNDNQDINALLKNRTIKRKLGDKLIKSNDQLGDQWQEEGPYLILLILPLLLGYFRRGNIIVLIPLVLLLMPSQQADASLWQQLWKTNNQQAQVKFDSKKYKQAAQQFNDPQWQGSAYYKAGNYQKALNAFKQSKSAEALYNQGNALAKLHKLDQAIKAYNQALKKNPKLTDAKKNKALLEQLKKQQQKKKQQNKNKKSSKKQSNKNKSNKNKKSDQQNKQQQGKSNDNKQQKNQKSQSNKSQQQQKSQKNKQKQDENSDDKQQKNRQKKQQDKMNKTQQSAHKKDKNKEEKQKGTAKQQARKSSLSKQKKKQTKAQIAKQRHDKEMQQKYQQLLNKVTDDPYLLLRNKMRLEYQKRRHNESSRGARQIW